MKTEKFGKLYFFHEKSKIKVGEGLDEGNFPFYTSSQIQNKWLNSNQFNTRAIIFGTGGKASVHFADGRFSVSTDCLAASSKQEFMNIKFVYYYLFGNIHVLERGFKGAGLKHISKKYIENLDIPVFPLEIQNKIVAVLDKASSLVSKREKTIQFLNEVLLASFLKMFGKNNPSFEKWDEIEVESLAKTKRGSMRTGPFGSSLKHEEFDEEGPVAVLGIDNAVDNEFKWKKKRFLTSDKYQNFKQYTVYPRDVIITIMGTVGRSAVIPENIGTAINTKHLAAITLDEKKCNPFYLAYSIHSNPFVAFQMKSKSRGAIMDGFNLGLIKRIKLKAAPIELQNEFEIIYKKNKQTMSILEASKNDMVNLFNSIIQKAFNSELNFNIDIELDALIKEIDLQKKENDLSKIVTDFAYLQRLIDRLNSQEFKERDLYDKAKHAVFQLLKEDNKIVQEYDENSKSIKLAMK